MNLFPRFSPVLLVLAILLEKPLAVLFFPLSLGKYFFWALKSPSGKRAYYRKLLRAYMKHWLHLGFRGEQPTSDRYMEEYVHDLPPLPHRISLVKRFRDEFFLNVCPPLLYEKAKKKLGNQ